MAEDEVLLRIEGLKTYFHTYEGVVKALEGIDLQVRKGETLGLVGETGCGKSVTAISVMGLIPMPPGKIEGGKVFLAEPPKVTAFRKEYEAKFLESDDAVAKERKALEDRLASLGNTASEPEQQELKERLSAIKGSYDLLRRSKAEMNTIRGDRVSMIFQEPMTALNPAYTVGNQIGETIELHQRSSLVDDALAQLEREKTAFSQRKTAKKERAIRGGSSTSHLEEGRSKKGSLRTLCSSCRSDARNDWGACTICGARFSERLPRFLRRFFFNVATSYYSRMKKDPNNTWAYMVRSNFITRRLERRMRLAKNIRAELALTEVKIAEPGRVAGSYPYELSGGMKQRAMIAMMMACRPDLLIADEPTTALDVTVEAQILQLMKELQKSKGTSILLITHDLGIIAEISDRVAVMYAGYVVEMARTQEIFAKPTHPYTHALLKSIPKIGMSHLGERKKPLYVIPGVVPNLLSPPSGCRFHPRCGHMIDVCKTEVPPLRELASGHLVACHNPMRPGEDGDSG